MFIRQLSAQSRDITDFDEEEQNTGPMLDVPIAKCKRFLDELPKRDLPSDLSLEDLEVASDVSSGQKKKKKKSRKKHTRRRGEIEIPTIEITSQSEL